jgi:triacylglycerol lipase
MTVLVLAMSWLITATGLAWVEEPAAPRVDRLDVPVVLVPGWFDTARDLAALRIRFIGAGVPGPYVHALSFADPTGSNVDHAEELDSLVSEVMTETGVDRVDIVAHSMGGLATRWYLNTHPESPVRKVAFLATPHHGTLSAHLAWGDGRDEMLPDSPFLAALNSQAAGPDGVEAITVRTPIDTHVLPPESATLPGVEDHVICCPSHAGMLESEDVFLVVLDFLEGGD